MRTLAALLLLALPLAARAGTWTVKPDGTGDFPTIQAAVDAASGGDEIVLTDGTFSGPGNRNVDLGGKLLTIRSASGDPATCVVDCQGGGIGFAYDSGETVASRLEGLTIVNSGYARYNWGAVSLRSSSATLSNLVIEGAGVYAILCENSSAIIEDVEIRNGASPAISCFSASPTITGCVIESNTAAGTGARGAIDLVLSDATIENCRIAGNDAGGGGAPKLRAGGIGIGNCSPLIRNCVIAGNKSRSILGSAGGVLVYGTLAAPTIESCTIVSNRAGSFGGISAIQSATVDVTGSLVWGNCNQDLNVEPGATLRLACSDADTTGAVGAGMLVLQPDVISLDPLFCGAIDCALAPSIAGSFTLETGSPALVSSCGRMGALGSGCVPTSVQARSWGDVKALYRGGRR